MENWILRLLAGGIFAGAALFGQGPFISQDGIMNRASQIPANLPGGAMAPGAMIQIRGQNLGPVDPVYSDGFPLRTRLGDLQTRVLANGDIECPLFSVAEDLINAQLPADLTGAQVRLRVITSAGESADITTPLGAGNFGMFTRAANGLGLASCQAFTGDPDPIMAYRFISFDTPAQQGQAVVCYGTGLGQTDPPIPAGQATPAQARARTQLMLYVGDRLAQVQYAGRAPGFAGLDQMQFTIPDDAPEGCGVPIRIQMGSQIGNMGTIALNRTGLRCLDPVETPVPGSGVGSVVVAGGLGRLGRGQLGPQPMPGGPGSGHRPPSGGPGGGVGPGGIGPQGLHPGIPPHAGGIGLGANRTMGTDVAPARFLRLGGNGNPAVGIPPVGSCQLFTQPAGDAGADTFTGPVQYLNAGNLGLTCSGTQQRIGPETIGGAGYLYAAQLGQALGSGTCTLSGTGGPDVGAFGPVQLNVPSPIDVTTSLALGARVSRQSAFRLNWTGGGPNETVVFHGRGFAAPAGTPPDADPTQFPSRTFMCSATASAGNFTVPDWVMNGLPAGPFSVNVTHMPNANGVARFGARGLERGGTFRWMYTVTYLDLTLE